MAIPGRLEGGGGARGRELSGRFWNSSHLFDFISARSSSSAGFLQRELEQKWSMKGQPLLYAKQNKQKEIDSVAAPTDARHTERMH